MIHRALASIIAVVSETDRYFAGQEPWALKKTDPARMATVLYVTAEVVRQIAILLQPFMPESSGKLLDLVAAPADKRDFACSWRSRPSGRRNGAGSAEAGVPALRRAGGLRPNADRYPLPSGFRRISRRSATRSSSAPSAAGVGQMITISTRVKKFDTLLAHRGKLCQCLLLGRHASAQCGRGAGYRNGRSGAACRAHPKVVAIGEAGLDYFYDNAPRDDAGRSALRRHIAAARETGLPLVIHSRTADEDMAAILTEETGKGAFPFCSIASPPARTWRKIGVELGGYVSFSGILTFPKSEELREIAKTVPHDRHDRRNRRAVSGAKAIPRQAQRAGLCRPHGAGSGRDDRRFHGRDRARSPPTMLSASSRRCRGSEMAAEAGLHHSRLRRRRRACRASMATGAPAIPTNPKNRRTRAVLACAADSVRTAERRPSSSIQDRISASR